MSIDLFRVRNGISLSTDEASDVQRIVSVSVAPNSGGGYAAEIGSMALMKDGSTGRKFLKYGVADTAWREDASEQFVYDKISELASGLSFRTEAIKLATSDTVPVGVDAVLLPDKPGVLFVDGNDVGALTDDGSTTAHTALVAGDFVIFGEGTTAQMLKVVDDGTGRLVYTDDLGLYESGEDVGLPIPGIETGDMFNIKVFLPDPTGAEGQAIVVASSATSITKIADIDFAYADGLGLRSFTADTGNSTNISDSDTIHVALERLEGNEIDIYSVLGETRGDQNLGDFSASGTGGDRIFADNSETVRSALIDVANEIGEAVVPSVRANNDISASATVNTNVTTLSDAIGTTAQLGTFEVREAAFQLAVDSTIHEKIEKLDNVVGDSVTDLSGRTNNQMTASLTVNENLDKLSNALGNDFVSILTRDAAFTLSNSNTIMQNIEAIDNNVGANSELTVSPLLDATESIYWHLNRIAVAIGGAETTTETIAVVGDDKIISETLVGDYRHFSFKYRAMVDSGVGVIGKIESGVVDVILYDNGVDAPTLDWNIYSELQEPNGSGNNVIKAVTAVYNAGGGTPTIRVQADTLIANVTVKCLVNRI